jgi:hypothetical protein
MKDLPHHIKKLNRRVVRSIHREDLAEEEYEAAPPARKQTAQELKKIAKRQRSKIGGARAATPLSPSEMNRRMKQRVPIFDRLNNAKPKSSARPSQKKRPRI